MKFSERCMQLIYVGVCKVLKRRGIIKQDNTACADLLELLGSASVANDILDELLLGTPHDTTDPSEMKLRKFVVTQMVKRYKKEWNMKPKEAEELHKQLMGTDNLTAMLSEIPDVEKLDSEAHEIAEKKKERNKRSRENKKKKKLMQQATVPGLKENDTVEKDSEDNSRPDSSETTASVEHLDTKLTRDTSVEKPKPEGFNEKAPTSVAII
ncbi:hypothetical protein CRE_09077 [Caenorhabditis remanei]|uniref:Uncharacterized protein n=1 Tax=Caenorhabditis remanei TaxID=31234 RepID=E3LJ04_CAERE|nr:hypothetical protein CRE_09077 [Caenorhabditis remanei]